MLLLIILFASSYVFVYQNATFSLALAWVFYGILDAYQEGKVQPSLKEIIQKVLVTGIVLFGLLIIFTFVRNGYAILPS